MIQTIEILPGVTLRCFPDTRFKQGCLSLQFVRPMGREEAALNALIPAVLLRGTEKSPDMRDIILRLLRHEHEQGRGIILITHDMEIAREAENQ